MRAGSDVRRLLSEEARCLRQTGKLMNIGHVQATCSRFFQAELLAIVQAGYDRFEALLAPDGWSVREASP
jgi:hypothetical protein